ncbi:MAG TPA: F0F1 ATP synthase subunit B [Longimicrobiales bacterium]|nr:F0F1 ATP synthase subunit B [Longimicrobiales bacterium]
MRAHRIAAALVPALAMAPATVAAQEGGAGPFTINPGLSIWTSAVFLLLLAILWRFAWGPILQVLDERSHRIQGALDDSAQQREEAGRLLEEHKRQLADARRQAQEIVQEGKAAGEKLRKEIEEKARQEGQALLERARIDIGREKEAALDEIRKEAVELALAAAGRLMRQELDRDRDRELVLGYLDDLSSEETGRGAPA